MNRSRISGKIFTIVENVPSFDGKEYFILCRDEFGNKYFENGKPELFRIRCRTDFFQQSPETVQHRKNWSFFYHCSMAGKMSVLRDISTRMAKLAILLFAEMNGAEEFAVNLR